MSYTALYRKFRPASFDDVKGQDHIVTTLRNQIKADRIGHAYLFCGTRGTGKTTVAKIFARSVNCETPVDGSPCGNCPTCRAIADGSALNVIEIDAASNNGVDNVREIIEEVTYSPTTGRFKVYIIDEVHMLSPGAFNALLKTLEEPPEYVLFILATTEPNRLPITILSRVQRYDFHRITIETIQDRLRSVADEEGLSIEDKALRYVAKAGDGSMRDALSLLDQCVAFHYGETLTYDMALDVLGAVDTGVFDELLNAIYSNNVVWAMQVIAKVVDQGRDLSQFNNDFIWYIRCAMLMKTDTDLSEVIDLNSEDMNRLKETSDKLSMDAIFRYIHILSELTSQLRYSMQKRILIEVTLIRMCTPQTDTDIQSISERMRVIENRLDNGEGASNFDIEELKEQIEAIAYKASSNASNEPPVVKAPLPTALPEDVQNICSNWNKILNKFSEPAKSYLASAKVSVSQDGKLVLAVVEDDFAAGIIKGEEYQTMIRAAIRETIGKEADVIVKVEKDRRALVANNPDIMQMIKMPIDIVEEDEEE